MSEAKEMSGHVLHDDELEASDRRWAQPPKPTSPEVTAAYQEIAAGGEKFSEPSGTVAQARRDGEYIPPEED
jgi:hypothetical protein